MKNYKEELMGALDDYEFVCGDTEPNDREIEQAKTKLLNIIDKIPNNYEPVPSEIKLSELLEKLNCEENLRYYKNIEYDKEFSSITAQFASFNSKRFAIVEFCENTITDIDCTYINYSDCIEEIMLMRIYKTKIIDDLGGENGSN